MEKSVEEIQNIKFEDQLYADCENKSIHEAASIKEQKFINELRIICSKRHLTPASYELKSEDGPAHLKTFTYECCVDDIRVFATASSKSLSKHMAAKTMIEKIESLNIKENQGSTLNVVESIDPIQLLQKFCFANKFPQALFTLKNEEGPAHMKVFTFECKVENFVVMESGSTKSLAKQLAAAKILDELKSFQPEDEVTASSKSISKHMTAKTMIEKIESLSIKENQGSTLNVVESTNPIQLLQKFCSANKFPQALFTLKNEEGPDHMKVFTFECKVENFVVLESGPTKSLAKQLAAVKILDELKSFQPEDEVTASSKSLSKHMAAKTMIEKIESLNTKESEESTLNVVESTDPIQLLQKFCSANKFPQALFTLKNEEGPAHKKIFTFECKVENFVVLESGPTKSLAKQLAAVKILDELKSFQPEDEVTASSKSLSKHMAAKTMIEKIESLNTKESEESTLNVVESTDPIQLLQKFCSANKFPQALFTLKNEEGPAHKKIFTFECKVENFVVLESGPTKSLAKQLATVKILDELKSFQPEDEVTASSKSLSKHMAAKTMIEKIESLNTKESEESTLNVVESTDPIQLLQKFCSANKFPQALFTLKNEEGPAHKKIFTFECKVENFVVLESGPTKSLAKQLAAAKILDELKSSHLENYHHFQMDVAEKDISSSSSTLGLVPVTGASISRGSVKNYAFINHLKKFCSEKKFPEPKYLLIKECGPSHRKEFTYQCTVNEVVKSATAPSKSLCKNLVAEQVLEKLKFVQRPRNEANTIQIVNSPSVPYTSIGKLLNLLLSVCNSKKIPFPRFDLLSEGPPENGKITCVCKINDTVVSATGIRQNEAKYQAIEKMLNALKISSLDKFAKITVDSVQELTRFCSHNNLMMPVYEFLDEFKIPPAIMYTFECQVEDLKETATAPSKKEAKQLVSGKLLEKLKSCKAIGVPESSLESSNLKALKLYPRLDVGLRRSIPTPEVAKLEKYFCNNPSALKVIEEYNVEELYSTDVVEKVCNLVNNTNIIIKFQPLKSRDGSKIIICVMMPDPHFVTFGLGPHAKQIAAHKMMCVLKLFL